MQHTRCKMALYLGLACLGGYLLARQMVKQVRMRDPITHANDLVERCRGKISEIESSLSTMANVIQRVPS